MAKMRNRSKSLHARHQPLDSEDEDIFDNGTQEFNPSSCITNKRNTDGWSHDDELILVENVKKFANKNDRTKYNTHLKRIDWNQVKFDTYSAEECEEHFNTLLKSIRSFRILMEMCEDIEQELVKMPFKRPLSSYHLFIKDATKHKNHEDLTTLGRKYKELSAKDKQKYENQAQKIKAEFNKKVIEFYKENPKTAELVKPAKLDKATSKSRRTPFKLFSDYNSLLGNALSTSEMRNEYNKLSIDAKYKWIEKSVKMYPDVDQKEFLNKEEIRILTGNLKRPMSAYALYVKDVYGDYKDQYETPTSVLSAIAVHWKNLDPKTKSEYEKRAGEMKKSTDQKNKSFMEKHEIVPEKKKRAKKSKIFDSNLENVEKGDASKAKKRSKKSNGIENEADGSSSNSKTKSLIQTKINFTEPKNKSKAKGIELTAECNPKKAAISNNITSSDSESSSQKKKKKKKKEVREPTPPPSSSSSTSSKKRKQNSESETHQEIASPKKGRHVLAPTPPRETSPKKKSRAEAFSSASSSPSTSKKRKDSVSDSQLPQSSFKREKSVEINDVGSDGEGPIDKPPNTQFDYYMMSAHNGKYEKARTAYEAMSKAAKKKLATEYNAKVQNYVVRLKSYLSSLSKQDAVKFIAKLKQEEQAKRKATVIETDSDSDSDSD